MVRIVHEGAFKERFLESGKKKYVGIHLVLQIVRDGGKEVKQITVLGDAADTG